MTFLAENSSSYSASVAGISTELSVPKVKNISFLYQETAADIVRLVYQFVIGFLGLLVPVPGVFERVYLGNRLRCRTRL